MNRRGIVLIFALLVILVLTVLSVSFFLKTINENNLVRRHVYSTQALWLAESGVADAIVDLPDNITQRNLTTTSDNYLFNATTVKVADNLYKINSTGLVNLSDLGNVTRNITVFVKTMPCNASNFPNAIEVNGNLTIRGEAANITGTNVTNANLSFINRFGIEAEKLRSYAIAHNNYYLDPDPNDIVVNGEITWVDVTEGKSMTTATGWNGSGILVVSGDADITGGNFSGILWVIGTLRMSGNPNEFGAIFSECDADINTTITGNVYIEHNSTTIENATDLLEFVNTSIVSWNEAD